MVGSNCVKVAPPSVEKATTQLAEMKITPPPLAPLGSEQTAAVSPLQPTPADVIPSALLMLNVIAPAGLVSAALVLASGGDAKKVLLAVGIPATKFPVGIGGDALLTSVSIFGG